MITDTEARRIASEWHGGGGTALYALSSTGAIDPERRKAELADAYCQTPKSEGRNRQDIINLNTYCVVTCIVADIETRGPVDGWSTLTW